ncbi:MAG: c-type cytochrome [Chloroflexota bacterium]|jgi:mono/diheme cytochrome c family protein
MQVKIIIGTIAFMLTMIIMGFAALREPARMGQYTEIREGRQIEVGAKIYKDQCATCHGDEGRTQTCTDAAGNPITCEGIPLNHGPLLCGDTSTRMETMGWEGTKYDFIKVTIAAGRGQIMPTWSERYGGPMRDDQVEDVTRFVLNWESEELCAEPEFVYDWPELAEEFLALEEIEEGDPERGAELYSGTYACNSCHGAIDDPATASLGPWLGELPDVADTRVEGQDALQYTYESILYPGVFIVPDCPNGPCSNVMPSNFGAQMGDNPQDMADIIAFLLNR